MMYDVLRKHICIKDQDGVHINCNHKYYYQIQQGMHLAATTWADFVVQGSQTNDQIYTERAKHHSVWWAAVKDKSQNLFDNHFVMELAYLGVKHGRSRINFREQ